MSEAESFNKILNLRNIYKRLNQLTWSIRAVEGRYGYEDPANTQPLLKLYGEMAKQFLEISRELEIEVSDGEKVRTET